MTNGKNAPKAEQESAGQVKKSAGCFDGFDFSSLEIKIEDMFKGGVHFGHNKSRKDPRMDQYLFGVKNDISIIDLEKTEEKLKEAMEFVTNTVAEGKNILFVGTKKQAQKMIVEAARICEMPYVSERWLGGTFTNFDIISKRTKFLRDGQEKMKRGEYTHYTKFEQMKIAEELNRLESRMGGIKEMVKLPGAIFIVGVIEDDLAIKEATAKNIPIVGLVDSNVNPERVTYPIPANEDALSSIKLMLAYMVKAVLEGKNNAVVAKAKEEKEKIKEEK
ncbi:MAG: 30S ribosomal protein S2 [Parcubacteria group bacterium]|jgi:small subunit ribosomal protein S2